MFTKSIFTSGVSLVSLASLVSFAFFSPFFSSELLSPLLAAFSAVGSGPGLASSPGLQSSVSAGVLEAFALAD